MQTLLSEIELFMRAHDLSHWQFGQLSIGDKHLVRKMRGEHGGRIRRVWPETEAKIRTFMLTYRPQQQDAA
jgi:hypothetical protein